MCMIYGPLQILINDECLFCYFLLLYIKEYFNTIVLIVLFASLNRSYKERSCDICMV